MIKRLTAILFILFSALQLNAAEQLKDIKIVSLDSLLNIEISTVSKYNQTAAEAPASISIITAKDIRLYGWESLPEILISVKGFYTSNDRNYNYIGVRGFGRPTDYNNRILLLLDGHTMNEDIFQSALIGNEMAINIDDINRIEIVRGPNSVLYGTGAMLAIINIITNDTKNNKKQISATTASYNTLVSSINMAGNITLNTHYKFAAIHGKSAGQDFYFKEFDTPENNNGIARNQDKEEYYSARLNLTRKKFSLTSFYSFREKMVPTASWENIFNDPRAKTLDTRGFIEAKYEQNLGIDKNLQARVYFDAYKFEGNYPDSLLYMDETNTRWIGAEFKYQWDIFYNNRLTLGAEYQDHLKVTYKYQDIYDIYFNDDFPFHLFSQYIQNEFQALNNLSLSVGLRNDTYSNTSNGLSPRIAIVYNPYKSSTIKLLHGEAFRSPNPYEKNYYDPGYQKNNPHLNSERIKTNEIIYEQRINKSFYTSFSVFSYSIDHLIDWTIDPSDSLLIFDNLNKIQARGMEFEMTAQSVKGFSGYYNITWQNAKDVITDIKVTNSPGLTMKAGFIWPLCYNFNAGIESVYESARSTVYNTKTDPFILTNLNLSSPLFFKHTSFSFKIKNLFNASYAYPGGLEHIQPAFIQNKRNFCFKLNYNFN